MCSSPEDRPTHSRWQFSLRGALGFTAWSACVAAWAAIRGPGVVVLATGLSVSALNARGTLASWQLPRPRGARLVQCGWALLFASLFLPAVRGCSNSSVPGWAAAQAAANVQLIIPTDGESWLRYSYFSLVNLANLALLLSPWAVYRARRGQGQNYAVLLGVGASAVWTAAIDNPRDFLAGYYVWSLAVLCVHSAFRLHFRTWAAMALLCLAWLALLSALAR